MGSEMCIRDRVMMIGEFDFDDTFNSDVTVPWVTWFLFIVFIIVMTLILMNLLVINLITGGVSNDFRTTNAKVITPTKNKRRKLREEAIKIPSNDP